MEFDLNFKDFYEEGFATKWIIATLTNFSTREVNFGPEPIGTDFLLTFNVEKYIGFKKSEFFEDHQYIHGFQLKYGTQVNRSYFAKIMRNTGFYFQKGRQSMNTKEMEGKIFIIGLQDNQSEKTQRVFRNIDTMFPISEDFLQTLQEFEVTNEEMHDE
ncbi:hypothetical protein [Enterococcus sp. AZ192]|uniref:hypothetical protein n=2 Tax=Enterococcus TaxID=1350 RepID=UPI003D299BB2